MERGFSFTEVCEMPVWLRKDLIFIFSQISLRRKEREALAELGDMMDDTKPKKKARKRATRH